jgi:glycosyltransferase involved in cell wall biosynthesis
MNIGILLPGFSSDENDWAIPVQLNLVRELAHSDVVRVLALRYPHRRDRYRVYGADVIALGARQARGVRRLTLWMDALLALRRLHREQPFDVLHAMWADETGLIAAWAGKLLGIPSVVSIAGGELARLPQVEYGLQRSAFSRWIVRQALEGADRVLPACAYTERLIATAGYRVDAARVRRVALGVNLSQDLTTETPSSTETGLTQRRLLHVASLVGVKNQATLLWALARLPGHITLDVLGDGPERGRLAALAAELGIAERVKFHGAVAHPQMSRFYQQADLHMLTSLHEGFGMVTIEAAAHGLPTVGTAVGILPDVPALGVSVPVGDDVALAAAVQDLLADEAVLRERGRRARAAVEQAFTVEHTVAALRAVYREVLR